MSCPMGYGAGASKAQEENPAIQGVYYADYLELHKVLDAQHPKSAEHGPPAHDELLFIITHQTYELWFKQILHEVHSVIEILSADFVEERSLGTVVSRLERVTEIQKVLVDQVRILETMLPLDFLDFRKFLNPASGFQSVQFRMLENRLGMPQTSRLNYQNVTYLNYFKYSDQDSLGVSHSQPTLLGAVNKWLERTPFLTCAGFDFWVEYREAVKRMLDEDKQCTLNNPLLNEESKRDQLASQERTERAFEALFNEVQYNEGLEKGDRRLSYAATKAALLIYLYRDEPVLQLPFRMLTALTDIDELLTTWRYRHTMMVQRMIGVKLGTGGSSGYYYLKATVSDRYKVFLDLFNLSTYLIPRSNLPTLPSELRQRLNFHYVSLQEEKQQQQQQQQQQQ